MAVLEPYEDLKNHSKIRIRLGSSSLSHLHHTRRRIVRCDDVFAAGDPKRYPQFFWLRVASTGADVTPFQNRSDAAWFLLFFLSFPVSAVNVGVQCSTSRGMFFEPPAYDVDV